MNGLTLLVLIILAAGIPIAFRAGMLRERRDVRSRAAVSIVRSPERNGAAPAQSSPSTEFSPAATSQDASAAARTKTSPATPDTTPSSAALVAERARLIRAAECESAALRRRQADAAAPLVQLREFAADRRRLLCDLADAKTETARYREIVVDLEDNAPPPLLDVPNAPDDLKLIVGVGPVLERMLQRLGIGSYRQIARWSEHDIDEFDARLPEFRGRIRRDGWVTQARALHQSKYGTRPY